MTTTTLQSIDEEFRKTEEVVNNFSLPLTIISITRLCGDGETLWTKYKYLIIRICSPRVLNDEKTRFNDFSIFMKMNMKSCYYGNPIIYEIVHKIPIAKLSPSPS